MKLRGFLLCFSVFLSLEGVVIVSSAKGMNCSELNCTVYEKCCSASISKSIKIASTVELGISFITDSVRNFYEGTPAILGLRKLYKPLGWIENAWLQSSLKLFLVFPMLNLYYPKYESAFTWAGAIPTFLGGLSAICDGVCYCLAKRGKFNPAWKSKAINDLRGDGFDAAADWLDKL